MAASLAVEAMSPTPAAARSAAESQYEISVPAKLKERASRADSLSDEESDRRSALEAVGSALGERSVIAVLAILVTIGVLVAAVAVVRRGGAQLRGGAARSAGLVAAIAVLTAVPFLALSSSGASGASVPARFWGLIPAGEASDAEFARMRRGGTDSIRVFLSWHDVAHSRGRLDWYQFDQVVTRATRRRLEVLPFVYGSPPWVARAPNLLPVKTAAQKRAWMSFMKAAVRRYGPRGRFWAQHAGPDVPIRYWQIWNEQNTRLFSGMPSPRKYATLLKISRRAVRQVDPGAKLIIGGMLGLPAAKPPRAYRAAQFLNLLYRYGIKRSFAGVALHPYVDYARALKPQLESLRAVLRKHRDLRKGIWITEIGWGSDPPRPNAPYDDFDRGLNGQAKQLAQTFALVKRVNRRFNIKRIYWYQWKDQPDTGFCSFCNSTGLFRQDLTPKPAWFRFVRLTGGRP